MPAGQEFMFAGRKVQGSVLMSELYSDDGRTATSLYWDGRTYFTVTTLRVCGLGDGPLSIPPAVVELPGKEEALAFYMSCQRKVAQKGDFK